MFNSKRRRQVERNKTPHNSKKSPKAVKAKGLFFFSYQLSVISYQLSVISYQLSVISYQLSVISYQLSLH
ncbi:hypothetical protein BGS_0428 [Beggiatoa sp. SS]|nr:hypothetical protein BGS_0428 [Beggiatoa sp. SS]